VDGLEMGGGGLRVVTVVEVAAMTRVQSGSPAAQQLSNAYSTPAVWCTALL
jgi:hypothetical protein